MSSKWVEKQQPCPCGKSSDGYFVDDKGSGFCFGKCGGTYFPSGEDKNLSRSFSEEDLKVGVYPHRGLSRPTLEVYNILTKYVRDIPEEVAFMYPKDDGVKFRHLLKNKKASFRTEGNMSTPMLFGMDKFPAGSKESITITEGEYDAPSIYQVTRGDTAAVSVRSSSQAVQDFKANWDYINSFNKIIIAFDNDDPGKEALKKVVGMFDFKKVYILNYGKFKDANDYLQNNEGGLLYELWRKAKRYTPDNIKSTFDEFAKALEGESENLVGNYPFTRLEEMLGGYHESEVIVVKGDEGIGKQLPIDTPMLTPQGYKILDEINVGDYVYGPDGKQTKVTFVTDTQYNIPCYKLIFSDGSEQISGGPHKWGVFRSSDGKYEVKTTEEIYNEGTIRGEGVSLYSVPITKPVEFEKKILELDPYTLGFWLGDGHSYSANIYVGNQDEDQFEKLFNDVVYKKYSKTCIDYRLEQLSFSTLKSLNLLANKHIPEKYLRSSVEDRFGLLQGLMDTDGSVTGLGCEFYTSSPVLRDDFLDLARGLGFKCRVRSKKSKEKTHKDSWTIWFLPHNNMNPFRYKRKAEKVTFCNTHRSTRNTIRQIVPVDSVPSKCIQVDNESHLYLCGKNYLVTHNTELLKSIEFKSLVDENNPIGIIHLEEDNSTTLRGLATYELKIPANDRRQNISNEEVLKTIKKIVKDKEDRLFLHTSFDVEEESVFIDNVRYLVTVCNCKVIFFDHISWLATGGDNEDERKKLDRISQKLKLLAKELRFTLIMISHVNDDGKTRGSRNITKVANTVIHMSRDVKNADPVERNKVYFTVEKGRGAGTETGPAGFAVFDKETGRLIDPEIESI